VWRWDRGWRACSRWGGKETEAVSFFELLVDGRRFFGCEEHEQALEEYLEGIPGDTVDVTYLHSGRVELEHVRKGRRKTIEAKKAKEGKPAMVNINCTVKVSKPLALSALEDKKIRLKEFARILADSAHRQAQEGQMAQALPNVQG